MNFQGIPGFQRHTDAEKKNKWMPIVTLATSVDFSFIFYISGLVNRWRVGIGLKIMINQSHNDEYSSD